MPIGENTKKAERNEARTKAGKTSKYERSREKTTQKVKERQREKERRKRERMKACIVLPLLISLSLDPSVVALFHAPSYCLAISLPLFVTCPFLPSHQINKNKERKKEGSETNYTTQRNVSAHTHASLSCSSLFKASFTSSGTDGWSNEGHTAAPAATHPHSTAEVRQLAIPPAASVAATAALSRRAHLLSQSVRVVHVRPLLLPLTV